jgi:hypothetical protein
VRAVPAFGQVHSELAAAVPGGAGGDVDQVAAQGGAPGFTAGQAGQASGGAQQVAADRGERQPGRAGGERARWQVGERPVGPVRKDLLGLGVTAVLLLSLERLERGVGEDGVLCRASGYAGPCPGRLPGADDGGAGGGIILA